MAEYIDREKVIEEIYSWLDSVGSIIIGKGLSSYGELIGCMQDVPTADVVEVVRCKDCFFYQKDKELAKANYLDPEKYCALLICEIDKNGFCSYGKRMDGDIDDR